MARRWELSARDLLAALRMKPYSPLGRDTKAMILRPLADGGWEAHQAARHEEAIRLLELAARLAPENPEIRSRLATARQDRGAARPAPAGNPAA